MHRIALTLSLAALLATPVAGQESLRPNVIFILADDLGYGDLGSDGQTVIQTPGLDRMAAEGIRFTQFYAGSTVCAPSRSVLMTGQHMGHTHVRGNASGPRMHAQSLRDVDVTVAEVLKEVTLLRCLVSGGLARWTWKDTRSSRASTPSSAT